MSAIALGIITVLGGLALAGVLIKARETTGEGFGLETGDQDSPQAQDTANLSEESNGPPSERTGEAEVNGKTSRKTRRRRKLTKSIERKIVKMYRSGMSPKEIAKALGISTSTVYRRVKSIASRKAHA